MRVVCKTLFDITNTGVKNNFNKNRMPFQGADGTTVSTEQGWHRARNQQRNWETINQIISLRTLPVDISPPTITHIQGRKTWHFEFKVDGGLDLGDDPIGALKHDCAHVPMIINLTEEGEIGGFLAVPDNISFEVKEP